MAQLVLFFRFLHVESSEDQNYLFISFDDKTNGFQLYGDYDALRGDNRFCFYVKTPQDILQFLHTDYFLRGNVCIQQLYFVS